MRAPVLLMTYAPGCDTTRHSLFEVDEIAKVVFAQHLGELFALDGELPAAVLNVECVEHAHWALPCFLSPLVSHPTRQTSTATLRHGLLCFSSPPMRASSHVP